MNDNQETPDRIEGNEGEKYARQYLVKLKIDAVNWQTLWKNPETGEYWKEFFPQSEAHGGGPPVFVKIPKEEAKEEFKIELT